MELVKIIKYLEKKFPLKLAGEWDHPGLQIYRPKDSNVSSRDVQKVLVCLDLTKKALTVAIEEKVDLIITRHPFIFGELKVEKQNPAKKGMMEILGGNQILVYSIHTNYDASPNQILPTLIEEQFKVKNLQRIGLDHEGFKVKLKNKIKLVDLKKQLHELFQVNETRTSWNWDDQQQVLEFYLVTGSGGQSLVDEQCEDCVFVTGEMKWDHWVYANDNQVQALTIGHYMENYFVAHLKKLLNNAFSELIVFTSDIENQYNY